MYEEGPPLLYIYFMYKSRTFKVDPLNKFETSGMEKAKIQKHNNKK